MREIGNEGFEKIFHLYHEIFILISTELSVLFFRENIFNWNEFIQNLMSSNFLPF